MPAPPLVAELEMPVLFVPELVLGVDALAPVDRARLVAHLGRVAAGRGGLVHPNVAWNALYFGWDPVEGTYGAHGVDLDACPPLRHGDATDAVPVGTLCWVALGNDVCWGEVVYKEGAHPGIGADGEVAPEISGGAATASWGTDGPVAVVVERLVVDFEAFGPDERRGHRLERFARQGRHLDAAGHVVVDAVYAPPADAEVDDRAFYARWLWRTQRQSLREGWLGACLDDAGDDEALWAALVGSLATVDSLLDEVPGLAAWGAYRYVEAGYRVRLGDHDIPLGAADARHLTASLASPPRPPARVAYRALRPRLVELAGAGEADLRFAAYPATVCHANRMVADTLAEAAPDGVLARAGHAVHLRLDDTWQAGGVWRAELLDAATACPLLAVEPTRPLGLGASGEAADVHSPLPVVEPEPEPGPGPQPDPGPEPEPEPEPDEPALADSHVHWCVALRRSHHAEGYLVVPEAAGLTEGTAVVRLAHEGDLAPEEASQCARVTEGGRRLEGLVWPFDFFPGIRLWCIAAPGSPVVHLATAALAEPVEVEGVPYWFALDPSVLDPRRPSGGEATLADLAVRVLRRHGADDGQGRLALGSGDLARCLFGPEVDPVVTAALSEALDAAAGRGRVSVTADGRFAVEAPRQGRSGPAGGAFAGADTPTGGGLSRLHAGVRSLHWVVLHLRQLPVSPRASAERRAEYRVLRADAPNRHLLPPELPDGYTFVAEHRRGS